MSLLTLIKLDSKYLLPTLRAGAVLLIFSFPVLGTMVGMVNRFNK